MPARIPTDIAGGKPSSEVRRAREGAKHLRCVTKEQEKTAAGPLRSATVAGAMYVEDIPQDIFSRQSCQGHDCCPRER